MREPLFDLSVEYEEMLNRGIRLSGEDLEFFVKGRVDSLIERLPVALRVRRILDYGCGVGNSTLYLASRFPEATIVGVDISLSAVARATKKFGGDKIAFLPVDALEDEGDFDLCFVNGVFHHIPIIQRPAAVAAIHRALRPGGCFALFENNPWNPGTRMVMARIPFDRDAQTLSPPSARRLLGDSGFSGAVRFWSLFFFPRRLAWLRPLEGALASLPLGAQYCLLATR